MKKVLNRPFCGHKAVYNTASKNDFDFRYLNLENSFWQQIIFFSSSYHFQISKKSIGVPKYFHVIFTTTREAQNMSFARY